MTHDPLDTDLEAQLRGVLRDRAATVSGPVPDLPDASPAPGAVDPLRRGRRWVLVGAAAACVVLVGAIATLRSDDEVAPPDHVVATQPTAPDGLGDGRGQALFHDDGDATPETTARDFLRVRLGDGSAEADAALRDDLDLRAGEPVPRSGGDLVPVTWTWSGRPRAAGDATSTVWVRAAGDGYEVAAATIEGFDLSGVRYETGKLSGEIRGPAVTDGYGTTTRATLTRRIAMPLIEPDGAARAAEGEPVAATVPVGEPFSRPITASGDLELAVRVTDDATGKVVGLAMTALPAPPDPDMEGFEDLTPAERAEVMEQKLREVPAASESPGCKEAGAFHMPQLGGFPTEVAPLPATRVDDIVGSGPTPAAAVDALASALGITWAVGDIELGGPAGAFVIARLPGGRLVDVQVYDDPDLGAWRVTEARTRGACRDFGGSNATPLGAANPKTTLGLSVVAEAVDGDVWYRTDGATQQVAISDHDLSTHWVNVAADQARIEGRIDVLRDSNGEAVLVDLSPELNVPG